MPLRVSNMQKQAYKSAVRLKSSSGMGGYQDGINISHPGPERMSERTDLLWLYPRIRVVNVNGDVNTKYPIRVHDH